jgi:cytochrome c oxidase cbb3-type subunit 3
MLTSFWHWFAIIVTIASILACWWLLHWTKGISDRDEDEVGDTGHVWDEDIRELNNPLPRWWLHLFNITIVFSLVYLLLYPGLGNLAGLWNWTQEGRYEAEVAAAEANQNQVYARFRDMTVDDLIRDEEAMDIGMRLFGNNCSMCHGSDARGGPGFPNLTDNEWNWGGSFDEVLTSITSGRKGMMPPQGADLGGEEGVRAVAEFVVKLSGREVDEQLAADGEAKFTVCGACHTPAGTGFPALGAPDLTNDIWLYGGSREDIIRTINEGRSGDMPSHLNLLNEDRRRILAAYVLGLGYAASLNEGGN